MNAPAKPAVSLAVIAREFYEKYATADDLGGAPEQLLQYIRAHPEHHDEAFRFTVGEYLMQAGRAAGRRRTEQLATSVAEPSWDKDATIDRDIESVATRRRPAECWRIWNDKTLLRATREDLARQLEIYTAQIDGLVENREQIQELFDRVEPGETVEDAIAAGRISQEEFDRIEATLQGRKAKKT